MSTAVVIPLHKPPQWDLFDAIPDDIHIYCVDDSPNGDLSSPRANVAFVRSDPRFGRRASASRNAGHLAAYRDGHDVIIALDSDCRPDRGWSEHHRVLIGSKPPSAIDAYGGWLDTLGVPGWYARGLPYERRTGAKCQTIPVDARIKLNMGLWRGVLDINAIDRIGRQDVPTTPGDQFTVASLGTPFPICGMNLAFAAELLPAFFFLPDVDVNGWPLSRHDDIWGGYILKKLMDKRGDLASFGRPVVEHTELSDRERALIHEHWMHLLSRGFYACVDEAVAHVRTGTYAEMYGEFVPLFRAAVEVSREPRHYRETFLKLADHMDHWVSALA